MKTFSCKLGYVFGAGLLLVLAAIPLRGQESTPSPRKENLPPDPHPSRRRKRNRRRPVVESVEEAINGRD